MYKYIVIFFCVVSIISFTTTQASVSLLKGFGGTVTLVVPCTCQGGLALTIVSRNPPSIKVLLWQLPITRPYAWFLPRPGVKTVGTYVKGGVGVCSIGVPPYCSVFKTQGTITSIGTSLK